MCFDRMGGTRTDETKLLLVIILNFPILFSSVQSLGHVLVFVTPWMAACQASLSITNSQSLLKLISIESVTPSKHLILYRPLLLMPSIFPSIRDFCESVLHIRWPKYWSFNFSISPSNEYSGLISFRIDWFDPYNYPQFKDKKLKTRKTSSLPKSIH